MTILVEFGEPKGIFGDPKKGRDPQFENGCIKGLRETSIIKNVVSFAIF